MASEHDIAGDVGRQDTPRPVLRGVKHQLVNLWMDSLYLVVEYPSADVFETWAAGVTDLGGAKLYEGVPYEGYILRRGAHGYKLSVWDDDARLYVTDRVNDNLRGTKHEDEGMGVMLQLGPKWLRLWGEPFAEKALRENVLGQLMLFGIREPGQYPIRINRLDIALDVMGLDVASFSLDEWQRQWVGYAKPRTFHLSQRSGDLSGITIGSRKGNVSFTVYDKDAESRRDGDSRFWRSVWGVGEDEDIVVTRFEWSFRPYQAGFPGMRYLSEYTFEGFLGLLNYATERWGRLCIPGADANHKSRWALAPLWAELRAFIEEWSIHYEDTLRPHYDLKPDMKPAYLNSVAGWLAGLQARVGIETGTNGPASLAQALSFLYGEGHTFEAINRKAAEKWEVFSRWGGDRDG